MDAEAVDATIKKGRLRCQISWEVQVLCRECGFLTVALMWPRGGKPTDEPVDEGWEWDEGWRCPGCIGKEYN